MTVAVSVGLAFAAILGAYLFVLWYGSATVIDKHEDRITVMERRWAETFGGAEPAVELEPAEAEEAIVEDDACPGFVRAGQYHVPIEPLSFPERPSPVPRGKSAEWVEAAIAAMRARNAERMARAITEEAS